MQRPSYEELLSRIEQLEKENHELRVRCGLVCSPKIPTATPQTATPQNVAPQLIRLSPEEEVGLFRGLFRGREDVFARRWYSKTSGKSGYQPVCANEWISTLCNKKQVTYKPWQRFKRYTTDGHYLIDNNPVERRQRPISFGRQKNTFSQNDKSAEDSAIFYTLLENCETVELDTLIRLIEFLPRLANLTYTPSKEALVKLLPYYCQKSAIVAEVLTPTPLVYPSVISCRIADYPTIGMPL